MNPLYVIALNVQEKKVIVGEKPYLNKQELIAADCNWNIEMPAATIKAACRIRYRHFEVPALLEPLDRNRVRVVFDQGQDGITPGQAAVFYDGDLVIGGGWIE